MPAFDQILQKLRPGAEYSNPDSTLESVVWAKGTTPPTKQEFDAAVAAADIPQTAGSGDFIHALNDLGWLPAVKAAVAGAGGLAADLWAHAAIYERNHPLVLQIAQAIGKTSDDLDELFRKTATY